MATFILTYPSEYEAAAVAALRAQLGEDAEGLTDTEACQKALLRYIKGLVRAQVRRTAPQTTEAVLAAEAASNQATKALAEAQAARLVAEKESDTKVEVAFEGV